MALLFSSFSAQKLLPAVLAKVDTEPRGQL
jgi:hypothetical protein